MVWVASLTFVAQAVKKKIATEKKFRSAFFVAKKFEKDYLKFFLILQREKFFYRFARKHEENELR